MKKYIDKSDLLELCVRVLDHVMTGRGEGKGERGRRGREKEIER
jgi:hypothetical protein